MLTISQQLLEYQKQLLVKTMTTVAREAGGLRCRAHNNEKIKRRCRYSISIQAISPILNTTAWVSPNLLRSLDRLFLQRPG